MVLAPLTHSLFEFRCCKNVQVWDNLYIYILLMDQTMNQTFPAVGGGGGGGGGGSLSELTKV